MGSLKSFIKSVRAAKTLKDERQVIQKESAKIRSAFRQSTGASSKSRRENVAKLLYLFTLGERTHFGQVECLKLLASPKFTDKRLGYLGTMLLLDEDQEVLMLVTNSLDSDLTHSNQYVVSLALTTLANIASASMARDLLNRVETLITAPNPYIRKKAALCALRIVRRVPEYENLFVEHARNLLNDDVHGVLLAGAALATDLIDQNPDLADEFDLKVVLTKLKQLSSAFAPEFDVGGVPDPFLQCGLLRLLRALGQDNPVLSEAMSDLLAQIATNTDNSKNVGNAVLYETVLTIFGIDTSAQSDSGLRVLGVNILAKFLTTKNINTRYAALNTLLRVVELEPAAVQRHRQMVLDCLADADVSIRRRALELCYVLINPTNIRLMVRELLQVLARCEAEFKQQLVFQIALNAERFAPSVKWHVDTLLQVLALAGNYTAENVQSAFLLLIINAPDLQLYATQQSYKALTADLSQHGLTCAALWLIGEYGDMLVKAGEFDGVAVSAEKVVDLVLSTLRSPYTNAVVEAYAANALVKLSTRLKDARSLERVRVELERLETSTTSETQQRAIEYSVLVAEPATLRRALLAKMPPPEFGDDLEAQHAKAMSKALVKRRRKPKSASAAASVVTADSLLELEPQLEAKSEPKDDVLSLFAPSAAPAAAAPSAAPKNDDILALFAPSSSASAAPASTSTSLGGLSASQTTRTPAAVPGDLLGLESLSVSDQTSTVTVPANSIDAWSNGDLALKFTAAKESQGLAELVAYFVPFKPVENINLQVALPKSQQLSLQGISRPNITSGEVASQKMKVQGTPGASIKLRMRLSYTRGGETVTEQFDWGAVPKVL